MLSVAAADPLMLDLPPYQYRQKAAQLFCPPSPPFLHSAALHTQPQHLPSMSSPPQPQHPPPVPHFQLLQPQPLPQPQQPFHPHAHSLQQQQQQQQHHPLQQQAPLHYVQQQQQPQPMPQLHFIQQPQSFFLAAPPPPPAHFPRQLSSPVSLSGAPYLLPAQHSYPRPLSPQPAGMYAWQQQQQQQLSQAPQHQLQPGFFTTAPAPGSVFFDGGGMTTAQASGTMYVMSHSGQPRVMTTAASPSAAPTAMLMQPPPPTLLYSSPQHLPQQPHPGLQSRVHSAPVLCHPVSLAERQQYQPQHQLQHASVVFSPTAQPTLLEYSREQPLAALCVKYEYHSIIECGVVDSSTGSRRLTQHCPYFGKEVECFTAVNDPQRTVLYRVSALAAKIDCATNKVGMYLARRRSLGSGIYQATAFRFKPAGRSGLKCGGYFLSLEACKDFEDHFVPKQPIILHAAAAAAADSTDSASSSSGSRSTSSAADPQPPLDPPSSSNVDEEKKEAATAAAAAEAAMEQEGGQLLMDGMQS